MAITVTATVEASNVPPRIRLNVAASAGETSSTVTRLNPDGTVVPVRTTDGGPLPISAGAGTVYDYEAPYGAAVTFSSNETPANVTAPVTVPATRVWLIHPGTPSLSMPVRLGPGSFTKRTRAVKQGVYWPMGRSTPIVVSDGARKGVQSSLVLVTQNDNDATAIAALVNDAGVVLLNVPTTMGYNFPTCYIAPGDLEQAPVIDKVFEHWMAFTLPFYVVARPAGGTQAQRTYADLLVYPTYTDLARAYALYSNVLAGP